MSLGYLASDPGQGDPEALTMALAKWTAGSARRGDVLRRRLAYPSDDELAADLAAVDRGESRRAVLILRGSYGWFPRRFAGRTLWLLPGSLVVGAFVAQPGPEEA